MSDILFQLISEGIVNSIFIEKGDFGDMIKINFVYRVKEDSRLFYCVNNFNPMMFTQVNDMKGYIITLLNQSAKSQIERATQ